MIQIQRRKDTDKFQTGQRCHYDTKRVTTYVRYRYVPDAIRKGQKYDCDVMQTGLKYYAVQLRCDAEMDPSTMLIRLAYDSDTMWTRLSYNVDTTQIR